MSLVKQFQDKLSQVKTMGLFSLFKSGLVVHVLEDFSRDSIESISLSVLLDHEKKYEEALDQLIKRGYSLTETDVAKIIELRGDSLVKFMLSFRQSFRRIRMQLRVHTIDELNQFNEVVSFSFASIQDNADSDDYVDYLTELPQMLYSGLKKFSLISDTFENLKYVPLKFHDTHGLYVYSSNNLLRTNAFESNIKSRIILGS